MQQCVALSHALFFECVTPQERVNLARKIEKIEFYNSREKHHDSWFKQAAEALEVDLDDDLLLGKTHIPVTRAAHMNSQLTFN